MNFYPAIDIKDGQFVRLQKGLLSEKTIYGDNPINQAQKFVSMGAKWIHIVDLDGAFEGKCKNMDKIIAIKKTVNCQIQVGGGIRDIKTAEKLINNKVDRIVLGTVALKKPDGVTVIWEHEQPLPFRLTQLTWLEGIPAIWVACEFSDMRAIRAWLRDEKAVAHENIYISSYWKKGRSEDQHKIEKRLDSEAFAQSLT